MRIRILRNTIAVPTGEAVRAVDTGETIDVDSMQARQLIVLGKATLVDEGAAPLVRQTPEQALVPTEIRGAAKTARKGR